MKVDETGGDCLADSQDFSHVYVLKHRNCDLLKIGKANSVLDRAKAFGIDSIDLGSSFALRLCSGQQAVHVEKTLHKTFKKWAVSKDDAIALGIAADGSTEWFSGSCRRRLLDFVGANSDLLEFTVLPSGSLAELLAAQETRRLARDQQRDVRRAVQLSRQRELDIRRQAKDVRLAARTGALEVQFARLALLLEQRMLSIENSADAVFLGCVSPCPGRFQLLFLSRPLFEREGRDSVWVDMSEAEVCSDGHFERIITSWASREDDECTLEQVTIMFPVSQARGDGLEWPQFAEFIARLHERPLDSRFFQTTAAEVCEACESFFEAKRLPARPSAVEHCQHGGRIIDLFDEGAGLAEIVSAMNADAG